MSAFEVSEIVLLLACALVVLLFVWLWVRRRLLASRYSLSLGAVRTPKSPLWRLGLLRLGNSGLEWFSLFGITTRPRYRWERRGLEVSTPKGEVDMPGLHDAVEVRLTHDDGDRLADIAVDVGVYTALRSWLESAPPGRGVNVA